MTVTSQTTKNASKFTQYTSFEKLKKLAEKPFDLTRSGHVTPERIHSFKAKSAEWTCFYGTERVTTEVMNTLYELAQEANVFNKMKVQQEGEVVNFIEGFESDNRRVLHTAMRDFFDTPHSSPIAKEATEKAKKEHEKLKNFLAQKADQFTDLVTVAIGGSDLGPRALCLSLQPFAQPNRRLHFVSNVDPDDAAKTLAQIDLSKTLIVVVSKSGSTIETVTNETFFRKNLEKAGLDPKNHVVSVTEQGSPMDDPSRYLECFHIWDYVGGRFSATSMCGCLTLAFAYGYDHMFELLRGANAMDKAALKTNLEENIPLLGALLGIWNHNFLNAPTVAFVPYSEALFRFPAHVQQVDMESNGKRIDRQGKETPFHTGPIIWGEPGTNAQHSFYQLIHQGTDPVPLELVGFAETQRGYDLNIKGTSSQEKLLSNLFAQAIALAVGQRSENPNKVFPGNRPSHLLMAKKLTPFTLGALFAYVEHKVAFQGYIWDINSFDQEGVQLGKVLANEIMEQFANPEKEILPLGKAFIKELKDL